MRNLFWGVALVTIGVLLLLDNLGIADFSELVETYWPLILIVWGAAVLAGRGRRQPPPGTGAETPQAGPAGSGEPPGTAPAGTGGLNAPLLHQSNVFGDIWADVTSQDFKGGSLSTVFGNCTLNLAGATYADGDHEMRVHGVFGDTLITVQKDAPIAVYASTVFGEMTIFGQRKGGISSELQVETPSYQASPRRMKIMVSKVFGNIRVM